MASTAWAATQLSKLLPIDEESINQIIGYNSTLSKDAAADNLKGILGDSPQALEFISSFNSRRSTSDKPPASTISPGPSRVSTPAEVPNQRHRKKKAPLNKLPPPRRPEDYGNTSGAYQKKDLEDYIPSNQSSRKDATAALSSKPAATQAPRLPPSAAGSLISDLPNVRTTSRPSSNAASHTPSATIYTPSVTAYTPSTSTANSRTSSPAPKTKIALTGGTSMHGASTTLSDLDSALRTLELQTNPSLLPNPFENAARKCDCLATRHPLLAAAPNCLNCGKIICVREGLGPCTFCNKPLLSPTEINAMIRSLREERGRGKVDAHNALQRRADVAQTPRPFQAPKTESSAELQARLHRDKLLGYQAQNARRTHVIDEAADFETPNQGQSLWASPVERAAQLKRQQKVLREQEWNAKPEWEKRRMVVSVDLVGGKVVKRMAEIKREEVEKDDQDDNMGYKEMEVDGGHEGDRKGTGAFGRNPLLGGLIRPVWKEEKGKEKAVDGEGVAEDEDSNKENRPRNTWRRVQDDMDDNEAWILDGGIYGGREEDRRLGEDERACG